MAIEREWTNVRGSRLRIVPSGNGSKLQQWTGEEDWRDAPPRGWSQSLFARLAEILDDSEAEDGSQDV
jgi:hypothetical protein